MRQTEITGTLSRELERLRAEDRCREERLTALVMQLTEQQKILNKRLDDLTAQLGQEREQSTALMQEVSQAQTHLRDLEQHLSKLVNSLPKP